MGRPSPSESDREAPPIRRWAFFALAMVVGLACVRLGFWQLDRLAERRAQNAAVQAQLDLPAVSLPEDLDGPQDPPYRRATARGTFDPSQEIYLSGRSRDGVAGVHVVTPLRLEGSGQTLLVDRGWISDPVYRTESPETWSIEGTVEVNGVLLPTQHEPALAFLADRLPGPGEPPLRSWRALFIPGIQAQLPYPILELYLMQETPPGTDSAPVPTPELDLSEGPHLGYAIQWFAFAAIAFVGGLLRLRRRPAPYV